MPTLPMSGGCLCGQVRWEITAPLQFAGYCHCTRCQRRTGSAAAASARIAPGSLRVLSGQEWIKSYTPPGGFSKVFCSNCGSALWSQDPKNPEVIGVRLGGFDADPGIRPSTRQYVAYAAPWEPIPDDGLPRFPEARR
ncbi:MAG TPA: GFA family protein [Candidatus Polarisedimenticolia bacterium]|nr:GFA family protein [Candidatus Polarisedimenticolia bacterium]